MILEDPRSFRAKTIIATFRYLRRQHDGAHLEQWHERLREYHNKTARPPLPALATTSHPANHMCYLCGATFHCLSAYYVHMGKEHTPDHHPTKWATGTRCLTCSREYHNYAKLVKHLQACPACAEPWRANVPQLDDATAASNREAVLQV